MSSWRARVQSELSKLPKRTLLVSNRLSGIDVLAEVLAAPSLPVVSLWIEESVTEGEFVRLLSAAAERSLEIPLMGSAATLEQALHSFYDYQCRVGPLRLVIGWAESCGEHLLPLLKALHDESHSIVVTEMMPTEDSTFHDYHCVDGSFLRMTLSEASQDVRDTVPVERLQDYMFQSDGHFAALQMLLLQSDLDPAPAREKASPITSTSPHIIIDGLLKRQRWTAAFDYISRYAVDRLPSVIDDIGNQFFHQGDHEYFFRRLAGTPPNLLMHPKVAYWYFASASALGRQWAIMPFIRRVLDREEAPELRAAVAIARPGPKTLEETSRALSALEVPVTLRAHGFALGYAGGRDTPLVMFREAMRRAEADGVHHLAVACGLDIAQLETRRGNYRAAIGWAKWSLTEISRRKVKDQMRRLSALATLAYANLLAGDVAVAQRLLKGMEPGVEELQVPGMEALISTIGDVDVLMGNFEHAERMYRTHFESAPVDVSASTALDLVVLELARGDVDEATRFADHAYNFSRSASDYEKAIGELALGMTLAYSDPNRAQTLLRKALEAFRASDAAVLIAQTTIWLTIVKLAKKEKEAAMKLLNENALHLQALSDSGWRLLSADHERLPEVKRLYQKSRYSVEISFLGAMVVKLETGPVKLSIKQAELVALIALHPEGLTSEQLHAIQHEGIGSHTRTKVAASRIRKILPVTGSPFRFEVPYRADFIEVTRLVSGGEVQKALNLYSGPLLPESESPAIVEHRHFVEETLRQAVLGSRNSDELIQLGTILDDDLEMWLAARDSLKPGDYRQPAITARIRRIKAGW